MKYCKGDKSFKSPCPYRMTCLLYDNWMMRKIYKKEEGIEKSFEGKDKCKNYEVF